MAIGLSDIKNSKKNLNKNQSGEKQKALRPWEGYDNYGIKTRTLGAQEAVRKAKEIVENNNRMISDLKIDLEKEINATCRPVHPAIAFRKIACASN